MITKIIFILLAVIAMAPAAQKRTKVERRYILIGKESENILYQEREWIYKGEKSKIQTFTFKNVHNLFSVFTRFNDEKVIMNDTLTKPRSFLDSITYYDEKWLLKTPDLHLVLNEWNHFYLIDTLCAGPDSIRLYRYYFYTESIE